jgi:hypothetical protein
MDNVDLFHLDDDARAYIKELEHQAADVMTAAGDDD